MAVRPSLYPDIESLSPKRPMNEMQPKSEGAVSIINPGAAQRKWLRRKRLQKFLEDSLPGQKFDMEAGKESTINLVRRVSSSHETIVAVGGDGTIADVLQGLHEAGRAKDVCVGIIPLGSGNAFRKSLSIPKNIRKAVELLYQGETKDVRLMEIEGRLAGFLSIGATALVTHEKLRHDIQGLWGHILAGRKIFTTPRWTIEAEIEDGIDDRGRVFARNAFQLKAFDCVVAKSNYFGYGWKIAPRASLDDDYLDITFFRMRGWGYVLLLPLLYFGLVPRRLLHFKARKLTLRGKDLPVQYHGEWLGEMDRVEIRVFPHAVRMICPSGPGKETVPATRR
jgi:diacylglycerol kinase (ATP)